jgi:putative nucleotidyltransferase with HDIG domain
MDTALTRGSPRLSRAIAATAVVVGIPFVVVIGLRAWGAISEPVLLLLASVLLSAAISQLGAALWKRRSSSGELFFGDLMLWGWIRHRHSERLLARLPALVGPGAGRGLSAERRTRLLERLSRTLEARDPHTYGHSRRVARQAAALAKRMSLPSEQIARIRTAAVLHDIGKVETPMPILEKVAPLSDREYEVVKRHATAGAEMVASLGDPELTAIVRHHHERVDGGGYPDGLAGEEIPLGARIVAVADTFDAVTSTRAYRAAMSHKQALALLDREAGTQFDPDAVRTFRSHYSGVGPVSLCAGLLGGARQLGEMLAAQLGRGAAVSKAAAITAATAVVAAGALDSAPPGQRSGAEPPPARGPSRAATPFSSPSRAADAAIPLSAAAPGTGPPPASVLPAADPVAPPPRSPDGGGSAEPAAGDQPVTGGGSSDSPSAPTEPHQALPPVPVAPTPVTKPVETVVEAAGSLPEQVTSPLAPVTGAVQQLPAAVPNGG